MISNQFFDNSLNHSLEIQILGKIIVLNEGKSAAAKFLEYRKWYCLVSLHCYGFCGSSTLYHFRPWLQYLTHQLVLVMVIEIA